MTPLPDWAIKSYAKGTGSEAQLARMVIALQQELAEANAIIDEHEKVAAMRTAANRQLVAVAEEVPRQLDRLRKQSTDWGDLTPTYRPMLGVKQ